MPAIDDTAAAVLAAAGAQALAAGHALLDHTALARACSDIDATATFAALVELREAGMVQMRDYEGRVALLQLTRAGLWTHLTRSRPDLADVAERLLDRLDEVEPNIVVALGDDLGESPLLVEALLDQLAARRLVVASRVGADGFRIHRFSR